jgi:hypothetical protein
MHPLPSSLARPLRSLAVLALAACGPAPAPPYTEIQAIYTQSCAVGTTSCHGSPAGRMGRFPPLTEGMSHAATVGVRSQQIDLPMITPGDPERSYLWHKINGTMGTLAACRAAGADCGSRMPMVGGGELTAAQLDLFRRWIAAGAPAQ